MSASQSRPEPKRKRSRNPVAKTERSKPEQRLTADLDALKRIHALSGRLLDPGGLEPLLQEIMDAAVSIVHAPKGTLQLLDGDSLRIVASYGHPQPFLDFFASAETRASACGEAMTSGKRVIVPDVETSPLFAGTPSLDVFREAGIRTVQSTPIMSRNGILLGILTTQWPVPHTLDEYDLWRIDLLAREAADLIEIKQADAELRKSNDLLARAERVANMGSWEWDIESSQMFWSEQTYKILGFSKGKHQPSNDTFFETIHPDDRDRVKQAVQDSLSGDAYCVEFRITLPDSTVRHLISQGDVDFDQDGKPTRMIGTVVDITERRQAEEALRERERLLQAVIDGSTSPIFLKDHDGKFVTINATLERMLGMSREDIRGKTDYDIAPKEVADHWRAHDDEVMATGKAIQIEEVADLKDGHHTFLANKFPLVDADGRTYGIGAISHDITERKQAEEALRESEARVRRIIDNLQDAYFQADLTGRFTTASPSAAQMFGYQSAEEMMGLQAEALYADPESRASMLAVLQSSGRVNDWVARGKRKDGTTFWISMNVQLHKDKTGHIVGTEGVVRDITQRRDVDEALRESQERFRSLSEVALEGVMIHSEGMILDANSAFTRMFGYEKPEEMIGKYGPELTLAPASREIVLHRMKERISGVTQLTGTRKDGSTFLMETESRAIRHMGQDATLVSCRDITARKKAEEALHRANEQLHDADRRKDEFLAMLAHELRNPLAAISSAIELLQLRGSQDPTMQHAREAAARQAAHMARLLDDLLDVARVTQRKVTLEKADVSLRSVVESAIETSEPFINARKHRLYVSHAREPMHVNGDPVRLSQAIGNLLHNAAKYTPAGGELHLTVEKQDDQVIISVRDDGKGIEPDLLPHVFELFVQGDRSPDRSEGGLGVGLTLVRSLVELHDGRVEACSDGPGKGSEFRIWLPLLPKQDQVTGVEIGEPEEKKSFRILVVDDNPDSVELMTALLEFDGHKVTTALNGRDAIEQAIKCPPEVALLDIGMPGMDGYEVARRLRQQPGSAQMMLVALTGYGQDEDFRKSRESGFDHHLVKPVDMEALRRIFAARATAMRKKTQEGSSES